jgi:hypothetical protein
MNIIMRDCNSEASEASRQTCVGYLGVFLRMQEAQLVEAPLPSFHLALKGKSSPKKNTFQPFHSKAPTLNQT